MSTTFHEARAAVIRPVPLSYKIYDKPDRPMSLDLARSQHIKYVTALGLTGLDVKTIASDEKWYDCVFVEDTAVVWKDRVLITRMQKERAGEHGPVRQFFSQSHEVVELQDTKSFLEGGDVMHTEDITYVGLSGRTNEAGIAELKTFLKPFGREVRAIPVKNCLHLKTGVTYLGDGTFLAAPKLISTELLSAKEIIDCAER